MVCWSRHLLTMERKKKKRGDALAPRHQYSEGKGEKRESKNLEKLSFHSPDRDHAGKRNAQVHQFAVTSMRGVGEKRQLPRYQEKGSPIPNGRRGGGRKKESGTPRIRERGKEKRGKRKAAQSFLDLRKRKRRSLRRGRIRPFRALVTDHKRKKKKRRKI